MRNIKMDSINKLRICTHFIDMAEPHFHAMAFLFIRKHWPTGGMKMDNLTIKHVKSPNHRVEFFFVLREQ